MVDKFYKPFTFDRVIRIIIAIAIVVGIVLLLNRLKSVLLPFFVAWLVAYLLNPLVEWNQRTLKLRKRIWAIFLTFAQVIVSFTLLGILIVPAVINEFQHFTHLITLYLSDGTNIPMLPVVIQEYIRKYITLESITTILNEGYFSQFYATIIERINIIVTSSIRGVFAIFSWSIVLLYIFFILLDYQKIITGFGNLIPQRYRKTVVGIGNDVKESMNRYFRGQALISVMVGITHAIGFYIIGLPLAIPMGLFVGLLNMVPYMQIVSYIPALFLCILGAAGGANFWVLGGLTILVYVVCQIIQDAVLIPKIMGKITGLNPAIILLSLSIWSSLLGFIGLIVALPLTTLLLSYYQRYILSAYSNTASVPCEDKQQEAT